MKLSLREDKMQPIISIEKNLSDELSLAICDLFEELSFLVDRTRYKPIVLISNMLIDYFNVVVKNIVLKAFEDWLESNNCFLSIACKFNVGIYAEDEAEKYNQEIKIIIEDSFTHVESFNFTRLENPNITTADLEYISECINKLDQNFDRIVFNCQNQLDTLREENVIANALIPLIQYQATAIKMATRLIKDIVPQLVEQFIESIKQIQIISEHGVEDSNLSTDKIEYEIEPLDNDNDISSTVQTSKVEDDLSTSTVEIDNREEECDKLSEILGNRESCEQLLDDLNEFDKMIVEAEEDTEGKKKFDLTKLKKLVPFLKGGLFIAAKLFSIIHPGQAAIGHCIGNMVSEMGEYVGSDTIKTIGKSITDLKMNETIPNLISSFEDNNDNPNQQQKVYKNFIGAEMEKLAKNIINDVINPDKENEKRIHTTDAYKNELNTPQFDELRKDNYRINDGVTNSLNDSFLNDNKQFNNTSNNRQMDVADICDNSLQYDELRENSKNILNGLPINSNNYNCVDNKELKYNPEIEEFSPKYDYKENDDISNKSVNNVCNDETFKGTLENALNDKVHEKQTHTMDTYKNVLNTPQLDELRKNNYSISDSATNDLNDDNCVENKELKYNPEIEDFCPKYDYKKIDDTSNKSVDNIWNDQTFRGTLENDLTKNDITKLEDEIAQLRDMLNGINSGKDDYLNYTFKEDGMLLKILGISELCANDALNNMENEQPVKQNYSTEEFKKVFEKPLTKENAVHLNDLISGVDTSSINKMMEEKPDFDLNNYIKDQVSRVAKNRIANYYGYPSVDCLGRGNIFNRDQLLSSVKGNLDSIYIQGELANQIFLVMKLRTLSQIKYNLLFGLIAICIPVGVLLIPFSGGLSIPVIATTIVASAALLTGMEESDLMTVFAMASSVGKTTISYLVNNYTINNVDECGITLNRI